MEILVTGGAGFIGSHTCVALMEAGHRAIVADNLCNSSVETLEGIGRITGEKPVFYRIDVADAAEVDRVFSCHRIGAVIHFAGLKAVSESVKKPLDYYYNNTVSTMVLAGACRSYGVKRFVFSSSATVYGDNRVPFTETMELRPAANPYGRTKVVSEQILTDAAGAEKGWAVALLRYFNPVGAHESGLIGEAPAGTPGNLMPYLVRVAGGELAGLRIFGNDYDTVDGTGVRDYMHVCDLAGGHLQALHRLSPGVRIYNLGTGRGTSVLQLVQAFEKTNGIKIPYEFAPRRPGDIAESYADVTRARRELGWSARRTLADMCSDAWRFEKARKKAGA